MASSNISSNDISQVPTSALIHLVSFLGARLSILRTPDNLGKRVIVKHSSLHVNVVDAAPAGKC